jgi:hypothetical protein
MIIYEINSALEELNKNEEKKYSKISIFEIWVKMAL